MIQRMCGIESFVNRPFGPDSLLFRSVSARDLPINMAVSADVLRWHRCCLENGCMQMNALIKIEPRQHVCEQCRYFRPDEWKTGYCRYHQMFVLKTFDCPRFASGRMSAEGGDDSLQVKETGLSA